MKCPVCCFVSANKQVQATAFLVKCCHIEIDTGAIGECVNNPVLAFFRLLDWLYGDGIMRGASIVIEKGARFVFIVGEIVCGMRRAYRSDYRCNNKNDTRFLHIMS